MTMGAPPRTTSRETCAHRRTAVRGPGRHSATRYQPSRPAHGALIAAPNTATIPSAPAVTPKEPGSHFDPSRDTWVLPLYGLWATASAWRVILPPANYAS